MYFLEAVSTSAGLIKPASTVSEMMREATEDSFLFNSKRSYIYQMITFLYYSILFYILFFKFYHKLCNFSHYLY